MMCICGCLKDPALSSSSSPSTVRREVCDRFWTRTANCPGPGKLECVWTQHKDSTGQTTTNNSLSNLLTNFNYVREMIKHRK